MRPVGGTRVRRVDMRFIAATNRNLEARVREGTFRKDLYYRLAVISIPVPPSRASRGYSHYARHLLSRLFQSMGKAQCHFDEEAVRVLVSYSWPGNGRELRNAVERMVMLATGDIIRGRDVQRMLPQNEAESLASVDPSLTFLPYMEAKERALEEFTKSYLRVKLAQHGGVITKAAEESGIPRQHFSLLMKRFLGSEKSRIRSACSPLVTIQPFTDFDLCSFPRSRFVFVAQRSRELGLGAFCQDHQAYPR